LLSVRNTEKSSVPKSYESEQSNKNTGTGYLEQQYIPRHAARLSLEGNSSKCREEIKYSLEINQHFFGKGQMTEKHLATFDDSNLSLMTQISQT